MILTMNAPLIYYWGNPGSKYLLYAFMIINYRKQYWRIFTL